jgi:lipopolysaccharide cholinephosphotransferase
MYNIRKFKNSLKTKAAPLLSSETVLSDGRLRQAQLKMLGMLQAVDAICKKHGLDYWLDAGTLLGAVRHQGFIPWDDDMDIGMTRASYEAFLRIAPAELPNHIWLQTSETDKGYYNLGAPLKIRDKNSYYLEKHETGNELYVQGIFIDVFVYDKMPADPKLRKRYKVMAKKLLRILGTKYSNVPMGHYAKLYRIIGIFFPRTLLNNLLQRIIDKSNRLDTPYLGRGYQCKISNLIHYDDVYPLKTASFESGEFNVFNNTDQFLREQYGDYMSLPPESERGMRHCKALIPVTYKNQ